MRVFQAWAVDLGFSLGMSIAGIAAAAGLSEQAVWEQWSIRTGLPTPTDPIPSVVRRRALEVRRGWTEEIRLQAEQGITIREQSAAVRGKGWCDCTGSEFSARHGRRRRLVSPASLRSASMTQPAAASRRSKLSR